MPWTSGNPCLSYEVAGVGPPLVLLHEIGGSSFSWGPAAALLATDFTVVRYDQRGAGLSERAAGAFTLSDQVTDLEQIVAALSLSGSVRFATIAASAAIAAAYALRHPERVAGLVLCAPALGLPPEQRPATQARAQAVAQNGIRSMVDMAMERMYPPALRHAGFDAYRARFLAQDPLSYARATEAFVTAEIAYPQLAAPCLFLAGGQDIRSPAAVAQMQATVRGAQLGLIADGGHILPYQAPQQTAAAIRAFLAQIGSDAG